MHQCVSRITSLNTRSSKNVSEWKIGAKIVCVNLAKALRWKILYSSMELKGPAELGDVSLDSSLCKNSFT